MSADDRRKLEREMAVQRADHITSEQYVESRYRSASWGSRNEPTPTTSSRHRNSSTGTRNNQRRDRQHNTNNRHDESREGLRNLDHRMRFMGFDPFEYDQNEQESNSYGSSRNTNTSRRNPTSREQSQSQSLRRSPGIFDEIIAETRLRTHLSEELGFNIEGGEDLHRLEEMMILEVCYFYFKYIFFY